jgi:hypothetical protein
VRLGERYVELPRPIAVVIYFPIRFHFVHIASGRALSAIRSSDNRRTLHPPHRGRRSDHATPRHPLANLPTPRRPPLAHSALSQTHDPPLAPTLPRRTQFPSRITPRS